MITQTQRTTRRTAAPPETSKAMSFPKKLTIGILAGTVIGALNSMILPRDGFLGRALKHASAQPSAVKNQIVKDFFSTSQVREFFSTSGILSLFCLGLVQDVLLTRMPKYVVKKLAPEKEAILDSKVAKVARIVLMSALYLKVGRKIVVSAEQLGILANRRQVASRFIALFLNNVCSSVIKETGAGLLGALGANFTTTLMMVPSL